MPENRRDVRYPARIVARISRRGETIELLTNDVSFRGVFLRTDAPLQLRQLVRVSFALPESKATVSAHAMVVHAIVHGPNDEHVPGVGLQFWGPMENAKAWDAFIHELRHREKAGTPSSRMTDKVRRTSERFKLMLDIAIDGKTATTRDVSETGMAIRTDSAMPVGMRATLLVRFADQSMELAVIVRRRIDEPGFKGLGVEFAGLDAEHRKGLVELVRVHAPREDAVIVAPGDARLH